MTTTASKNLTARQKARQAMERENAKLKKRQDALTAAFAALDEREALDIKVGRSLRTLLDLGETNSSAGELLGLTAREVGTFARKAQAGDADGGEGVLAESPADTGSTAP